MVWAGKLIIQQPEKAHVKPKRKASPGGKGRAGRSSSQVESPCEEDLADHGWVVGRTALATRVLLNPGRRKEPTTSNLGGADLSSTPKGTARRTAQKAANSAAQSRRNNLLVDSRTSHDPQHWLQVLCVAAHGPCAQQAGPHPLSDWELAIVGHHPCEQRETVATTLQASASTHSITPARGSMAPRDCTHQQRLRADNKAQGIRKGGKASSWDASCRGNTPAADPDLGKHPTRRTKYQGYKTSHTLGVLPPNSFLLPRPGCAHTAGLSHARSCLSPYSNSTRDKHSTGAAASWHLCRREDKNLTFALPAVGLWPKTPLKKAGIRMLPPMSEPTPMTEQAAAKTLPSPPTWEKTQQKTMSL